MFDVVPLTLAISLLLVAVFVYFFWREHSRRRFNSSESDALLPLAEEKPRVAGDHPDHPDQPDRPDHPNHSNHSDRPNKTKQS